MKTKMKSKWEQPKVVFLLRINQIENNLRKKIAQFVHC